MSSQRDCNTCARHKAGAHPKDVLFMVPVEATFHVYRGPMVFPKGQMVESCYGCLKEPDKLPYYVADPAKMVKESSFGPEDSRAVIEGINEAFSEWLVKQCERDMQQAAASLHPLDPTAYQPVRFRRLTEKQMAEGMKGNPLKAQVGGTHYKTFKIQPVEFVLANGLGFLEGNIIKYVSRQKGDKTKRLEDLDKAIHCIELLKQHISNSTT